MLTLFNRSEEARIARWEWINRNGGAGRRYAHNPGATKALIAGVFILMALGLALVSVGIWKENNALTFIGTVLWLAQMVPWTLLRSSIQVKDSAPLAVLDEMEVAVLDKGRRRALAVLLYIGGIGGFALVLGAMFFDITIEPDILMLIFGVAAVIATMVASMLPAIIYALTFNQPLDDEEHRDTVGSGTSVS